MKNEVKIILCDLILSSLQFDDGWEDLAVQVLAKAKLEDTMEEINKTWYLIPEVRDCLEDCLIMAREKLEIMVEKLERENVE